MKYISVKAVGGEWGEWGVNPWMGERYCEISHQEIHSSVNNDQNIVNQKAKYELFYLNCISPQNTK